MKSTGVTRPIDNLGRIIVPVEIRRKLGWNSLDPKTGIGDRVEFFLEGDRVIMEKYKSGCTFCGEEDNLKEFMDNKVCTSCIEKLSQK